MKIKLKGLSKRIGKIYKEKMWGNEHYYQIYFGGSSSGKSYSLAQMLVLDCLKGRNILALRKVGATINKSLFNEVLEKINNLKIRKYFHINKSNYEITCLLKGSQILFAGADDPEKLKSIRARIGVIDTIWMEEATEFTYKDFKAIIKRLRGNSSFKKRVILSFNPVLKTHWIFKQFFDIWREGGERYFESETISILKTTYVDNDFLAPEDIEQLENETDPYYHAVYTLGEWGVAGDLIFKNWTVEEFDKNKFSVYKAGLDWGFAKDPFSWIVGSYERRTNTLWIMQEVYQSGLLDEECWGLVNEDIEITADSAEPKSIALWRNKGFNIAPAKKGMGSIETGIRFLQGMNIKLHPDCINTIREFQTYQWQEDSKGVTKRKAVDRDNHAIDAIRYMVEEYHESRQNTTVSISSRFI